MIGNVIMSGIFIVGIFSMVMFFVEVQKEKLGTETERGVLGLIGYLLAITFGGGFLILIFKAIF